MDYDYGSFDDFSSGYSTSSSYGNDDLAAIGGTGLALGVGGIIISGIIGLIIFAIHLYLMSRYFVKMGYSGWLTLLNFIPFAPVVMWFYFAFAEWPVEKKSKGMTVPKVAE